MQHMGAPNPLLPGPDRIFKVWVLINDLGILPQLQQFTDKSHQGGPTLHYSNTPILLGVFT